MRVIIGVLATVALAAGTAAAPTRQVGAADSLLETGTAASLQEPGGAASPRQTGATASVPQLEVDHERSTLVARTGRAGLLRFLGHEHGIVPGAWTAQVLFDEEDLAASRIAIEIDAAGLIIDSDHARRLAGVDADGPDAGETAEIRDSMLSAKVLDVASFPVIRFHSTSMQWQSAGLLQVAGIVRLHGVERPVAFAAEVADAAAGGRVVRGELVIRQRDFGMEPVSIGGVVKVADEIDVVFEVFLGAAPGRPDS